MACLPGAQLPCVRGPRDGGPGGEGGVPLLPFSQGQKSGSPRTHTALAPSVPSGFGWAIWNISGCVSMSRHSLVLCLGPRSLPPPGMDRLRTPTQRTESCWQPWIPASETLPFMHLYSKYLSYRPPLCPLLEGQSRGQPGSIKKGRLGKRPSPFQQFSV